MDLPLGPGGTVSRGWGTYSPPRGLSPSQSAQDRGPSLRPGQHVVEGRAQQLERLQVEQALAPRHYVGFAQGCHELLGSTEPGHAEHGGPQSGKHVRVAAGAGSHAVLGGEAFRGDVELRQHVARIERLDDVYAVQVLSL